jgi:hypothetical protein
MEFLGEWSIVIGYEMSSSSAGVYTTVKSSLVESLKHEWKNDMVANMAKLLMLGEFSGGQVSMGATSNPRIRNLTTGELQLGAFLLLFYFPSCLPGECYLVSGEQWAVSGEQ